MVTGAGSGIGRAAVAALVAAGARVLAVGRTEQALKETAAEAAGPGEASWTRADIRRSEDVEAAVRVTEERYGPLQGAFNAAGTFGRFGPLHGDDPENFAHVVGTNLGGVWDCMRHQLPRIREAGGGSIVNCASVAAHLGHARSPLYSATKHAVIGLSKSAALQYAADNVRVNVISPGSTDTPMLRSLYPSEEALDARRHRAPLRRLGTSQDVAGAVLWLLDSTASGYVTGQTVIVDGGVTAGSS
jgi:NAD(P)-dependent dehydrogenase (short-subunit alcohol dehydrogenase family)